MKNNDIRNIPDLSWSKADYMNADIETPEILENDDLHTEGELMSDDDIVEWISDTEKTFIVIKDQERDIFEKLYQKYILDIHYLCELGKLSEEDADEILRLERFDK